MQSCQVIGACLHSAGLRKSTCDQPSRDESMCLWQQVFKPALPFAGACLLASAWLPGWVDVGLAVATGLTCMSQQFHAWAHMKGSQLPSSVMALQVRRSCSLAWSFPSAKMAACPMASGCLASDLRCCWLFPAACVIMSWILHVTLIHFRCLIEILMGASAALRRMRVFWCPVALTARITLRHSRGTTALSAASGTTCWTNQASSASWST